MYTRVYISQNHIMYMIAKYYVPNILIIYIVNDDILSYIHKYNFCKSNV